MNQTNHQNIVTANLQQLTSNLGCQIPKISLVVSDIMGRLNHHDIDNGDFQVHPSEFVFEYNSESVPYSDTTTIKSIDDYEMDYLMELFHSEYDGNGVDVELQMLQD